MANTTSTQPPALPIKKPPKHLPKRIILVRHGETLINQDETVLEHIPNHKIKLIETGRCQAQITGSKIRDIISDGGRNQGWRVIFYVSPLSRTRETADEIMCGGKNFPKERVLRYREECLLREQHFGNFQDAEERRKIKQTRNSYGKFFYRVPGGESSADVYDRVSTFIEGLWRDMDAHKFNISNDSTLDEELNLIVVSHGLTILLFLMKWFNWTVDEFEGLANPLNCEYRVMQRGHNGEYSLALHHTTEELKKWGLSEAMIRDQEIRASDCF